MYLLVTFICGILFGAGLTISNMTNPYKVLNFLDVFGPWDPTLLLVMAGAVIVTLIGYQLILKTAKPKLSEHYHIPERSAIDKRLIIGSTVFGIGWGLAGYCPGPGMTALATLNWDPLLFVIGMVAGSYVFYLFANRK